MYVQSYYTVFRKKHMNDELIKTKIAVNIPNERQILTMTSNFLLTYVK